MKNIKEELFDKKLKEMINENIQIKSRNGKETYTPSSHEEFKQIYISPQDSNAKYTKIRSMFKDNYFIGSKGTLLTLTSKNEIRLIENIQKKSERKRYELPLNNHKKRYRKFFDYQLAAIVFESNATESAEKLLIEKGLDALTNNLIDIHHTKGLDYNDQGSLNITLKGEHTFLHKSPPTNQNKFSQLHEASGTFPNITKPIVIILDEAFDKNTLEKKDKEKYSEIISISPKVLSEIPKDENIEIITKIKDISFNNDICSLYINTKTNEPILINSQHKQIKLSDYEKEIVLTL